MARADLEPPAMEFALHGALWKIVARAFPDITPSHPVACSFLGKIQHGTPESIRKSRCVQNGRVTMCSIRHGGRHVLICSRRYFPLSLLPQERDGYQV